jgi:membrane-bound inhibitor of C-type lysozyme
MTLDQARKIIKPDVIQPDGSLYSLGWYLAWTRGASDATLDGIFTADELEAIAVLMRAKPS